MLASDFDGLPGKVQEAFGLFICHAQILGAAPTFRESLGHQRQPTCVVRAFRSRLIRNSRC